MNINKRTNNVSAVLPSQHSDYVSAIAFDHYGRRIATCSADRQLHIWDLDDQGQWVLSNSISAAHYTGVSGVSWSHPEFGQLLVSCGYDGVAIVWEERTEEFTSFDSGPAHATTTTAMNHSRWVERVRMTEARRALTCVQFAPRQFGLWLATGSADGFVRCYEAVDAMNLSQWLLKNSIEVLEEHSTVNSTTAVTTVPGVAATNTSNSTATNSNNNINMGLELGVTCLDWSTGRFEGPALVVGAALGAVHIYKYSDTSRTWILYLALESHISMQGLKRGVLDVAWAPNVGRSFHLIASCGRDGILRVSKLKRVRSNSTSTTTAVDTAMDTTSASQQPALAGYDFESSQCLDTRGCEIWRVAWNITGTVLAGSGDYGVVTLWKADHKNEWKCVSEIKGDMKSPAETSSSAAH